MTYTVDLFAFIKYPAILFMGYLGLVSWWVVLAFFLVAIEIEYEGKLKPRRRKP